MVSEVGLEPPSLFRQRRHTNDDLSTITQVNLPKSIDFSQLCEIMGVEG